MVPNSVDGRSDPNIDIVGMKGIPDEFFQDDGERCTISSPVNNKQLLLRRP